jgi:hypothetical protein
VAAAQITHAAGESSPGNLPPGTYAVVLAAPSESALETISERLPLEHIQVRESDPPYCHQLMAIGVRPTMRSKARQYLSSLPLYRGPQTSVGVPARVGSEPPPTPGREAHMEEHRE